MSDQVIYKFKTARIAQVTGRLANTSKMQRLLMRLRLGKRRITTPRKVQTGSHLDFSRGSSKRPKSLQHRDPIMSEKAEWASDPGGRALIEPTAFGKAVGYGGGGLAAVAGLHGVSSGVDRMQEKIRAKRGWKRTLRDNPDLKRLDRGTLKKNFHALAKYSPAMATNPTAAGSFLRMSAQRSDIGLDPATIKTLVEIQERYAKSRNQKGGSLASSLLSASI